MGRQDPGVVMEDLSTNGAEEEGCGGSGGAEEVEVHSDGGWVDHR